MPPLPAPEERFSPEGLLDLSIHDLAYIPGALPAPWAGVVRNERARRGQLLEQLRNYLPDNVEAPPYNDQDPAAYFAAARAAQRSPLQLLDGNKMPGEVQAVRNVASAYVQGTGPRERLAGIVRPRDRSAYPQQRQDKPSLADLEEFFTGNLYAVVGTARSVALRAFEAERNRILRLHFAGMELMSVDNYKDAIKSSSITGHQLHEIETQIRDMDRALYRAPYPDFFQFTPGQQIDVVGRLGSEWEMLCRLIDAADSRILTIGVNRATTPLALLPVSALKEAIDANPSVDAAKLCMAFLRTPLEFESRVARLKIEVAAASVLARSKGKRMLERWKDRPPQLVEIVDSEVAEDEFMQFDHTRIGLDDRQFYMPLEHRDAILAARVLELVARHVSAPHIDGIDAVRRIWGEMPEADRRLFYTAKEREKGSTSRGLEVIRSGVMEIFRRLLSPLGITRETSGERFRIERRPVVSLELSPPDEAERSKLLPIFPPGTPRERVAEARGDRVPDTVLAAADTVIDAYLRRSESLAQQDAVDLLNFITDHYGKRALRIRLEAAGGEVTFPQAMQRLHRRIQGILAEGYSEAYLNRVVAGHIATGEHKIRHVSGQLPIRTFVQGAKTTRWYIGK